MRIHYHEDEWRWYDREQENWYCSYECAASYGAWDEDLVKFHRPDTVEGCEEKQCVACQEHFWVAPSWKAYR